MLNLLESLMLPLEGLDPNQPGYVHRQGWNAALMRAIDTVRANTPAQQDAPTDADLQQAWYDAVGGTFVPEDVLAFGRMVASRYAPAQDAERERDAGIEAAARWIDTRRDDFDREHGYEDPDTGALEYGTGPHAEAKREYSFELAEIAEGLRALKSDAARAQRADKGNGDE